MPDSPHSLLPATLQRQHWLAALAHAPRTELQAHAERELAGLHFDTLRAPQVGLVMVRARIANQGSRYNLGEASVTRCAVRYSASAGAASLGVGYVLGRDEERAVWVAQFDALLQQPTHQDRLLDRVVQPLRHAIETLHTEQRQQTARSTVDFYTLQAESAA